MTPESGVNPYWRRNLYVCLFGSFVNMAGMTILLPFLPNYIRDLGVATKRAHFLVGGGVQRLFPRRRTGLADLGLARRSLRPQADADPRLPRHDDRHFRDGLGA